MKRIVIRILITILFLALISLAVMLLWNAIIPTVIGWSVVNYWQALGLIVLSRLFLGKMGGSNSPYRRGVWGKNPDLHDKIKRMSKSEKQEYIKNYIKENGSTEANNE
ncbi:MAG: hypothetical protein SNG49_00280 [Rikenellaceae bacterium]